MMVLEEALLLVLLRLPGFTFDQVCRFCRLGSEAATRRLLRGLEWKGLIRGVPVRLPPEEIVNGAFAEWHPGAPAPDFSAICNKTSKRWRGPMRQATWYTATPLAARIFGRRSPKMKRNSLAHDQHLAAVFLYFRKWMPLRACDWMSEPEVAEMFPGAATPDAAISDGNGGLLLAVEVVGHYRPSRILRLHRHFEVLGVRYELR